MRLTSALFQTALFSKQVPIVIGVMGMLSGFGWSWFTQPMPYVAEDIGIAILAPMTNPDYEITTTGNAIVITDIAGNSDTLNVTENGSDIRFDVTDRTYSLDGGGMMNFPVDVPLTGVTEITINAEVGDDEINVGGFSTNLPDLTINGGTGNDWVFFFGDITFAANAHLNVDLQNDDPSPGIDQCILESNTNLLLSGTGSVVVKVSRHVIVNNAASIETVNGDLLIEANQQVVPTSGNFIGLYISNGLLQTSGFGIMTLKGKGGDDTQGQQDGIRIDGDILGGTTGTLTVMGTGGNSEGSFNNGVRFTGVGSSINSLGAHIQVTGLGGGNAGGNSISHAGVRLGIANTINAGGDGSVTVEGTGGTSLGGQNIGVSLIGGTGQDAAIITSSGGNVQVTGQGGSSTSIFSQSRNVGVFVKGGSISAIGNGTVTVIGTGGAGASGQNHGVHIEDDPLFIIPSFITSSGGDVQVTGFGGGIGTSFDNLGVRIEFDATISVGGNGILTVEGTGGLRGIGVHLLCNLSSANGDIQVIGNGGGTEESDQDHGISIGDTISAGGEGNVMLIGTGGEGTHSVGVNFSGGSITTSGGNIDVTGIADNWVGIDKSGGNSTELSTVANGGNVNLIANSIRIDGGEINTDNSSTVTLKPYTNGVEIDLGATQNPVGGPLSLSNIELNTITTGTLIIGSDSSGSITVSDTIDLATATDIQIVSGGDILISGGQINTAQGDLLFAPGISPAAVKPAFNGTDVNVGTLSFESDLEIEINSVIPGTGYHQLTVIGTVDLTGVDLILSGSYTPTFGEAFVIVDNDGVDPVIGTFNNLPEGDTISNVGNGLDATISYVGGTGNDVVITLHSPDYMITTDGGHLVIADVRGNGATLSVSQSGSNIFINDLAGTFSLDGGPITPMPAEVPLAGLLSITINAAGGNDIVNFHTFISTLPDLTINGGIGNDQVNFNNDIDFMEDAILEIDLQDDDPDPGIDRLTIAAGANLLLSGTGSVTVKVSRNVLINSGGSIETEDGDITVEANQQLIPTTESFIGVDINGGLIQSNGNGTVVVKGRGGMTGNNQYGIQLRSAGKIIGGAGDTLTVVGTGGSTSGSSNYGLYVNSTNARITSGGCDIDVTGTGGGTGVSQANYGVYLFFNAEIFAGGNGNVSVLGNGGNPNGTGFGVNSGVTILLGSKIYTSGTGAVTVVGVGGNTSGTGSLNSGINISGGGFSTQITSSGGNVTVTGTGGGSGTGNANYGVWVQSGGEISAGVEGSVIVTGHGGNNGTGEANIGVLIDGLDIGSLNRSAGDAVSLSYLSNARITSSGGNVQVTGNGGGAMTSYLNDGVHVTSNGEITAGGDGTVMVIGNGGDTDGGLNSGVFIQGESSITSSGGNVQVTGTGGDGSGNDNYGVRVFAFGEITAGGNGIVSVEGIGGSGTGNNNRGVFVSSPNAEITSSGGDIIVTGIEGEGTTSVGIVNENSGSITTAANGGDIHLIGNSIHISANVSTDVTASVIILPLTNSQTVDLGATGDPIGGPLQLTDTELDSIHTGTLVIGNALSDTIIVSADITRSASTNMQLSSGSDILISGGQINTNGGLLLLDPGASPAAVRPIHSGVDVTADELSFGSDLAIVIDGTTVDVDYTQLNVAGMINLTDVDLELSGTYSPTGSNAFIIVNNDSTDPIIGTFNGLPQYSLMLNFFGSYLDAIISYIGGTGNDCVLKVGVLVWEGTVNSDWHEPLNWSRDMVPTIDDYALIPDTPNDPVIFSMTQAYARSIDIGTGATLTVVGMLDVEE